MEVQGLGDGFWRTQNFGVPSIMENQMEKKMENETET